MPELPEVETIVRYLRPRLRGKRILDLWRDTPRPFRGSSFPKVKKGTLGARILDLSRRGKNILFHLSNGRDLIFHLMMTGNLLLNPQNRSYVRFQMKLSGGANLALRDIRKFGWIRVMPHGHEIPNVGPDARVLKFKSFKSILGSHQGTLKPLLLSQKVISGIGNIYSDEILWYAGIHPKRKADSLGDKEIKKLYLAMRHILGLAIRKEGTSARDYRKPDGSRGGYYEIRKAYQRTGEKCSRDGTKILRIKIGSRSAHFCPKHQK